MNFIKIISAFLLLLAGVTVLKAQTYGPMPADNHYSFEYFDKNKNGVLDPEELSIFVFTEWNRSGTGYLIEEEWRPAAIGWHKPFTNKHIQDFSYWDRSGNGRLYPEDIYNQLQYTGLFSLWDRNGDGGIAKTELNDALADIYEQQRDMHFDAIGPEEEFIIFFD